MKTFLKGYPTIYRSEEAAQESFRKLLDSIVQRVILECEERATEADDVQNKLPHFHRSLHVKGWHMPRNSLYVSLNTLAGQVAVLGNGYGSPKEKKDFLPIWDAQFKQVYKSDSNLHAFTWIDKGEDDDAWECGYIKQVRGTAGKLFDPAQVDEFSDYFYWGSTYPFDPDNLGESFLAKVAADTKKLILAFAPKKFKRV